MYRGKTDIRSTVHVRAPVGIKWESKGKAPETENHHLKADDIHAQKHFYFMHVGMF